MKTWLGLFGAVLVMTVSPAADGAVRPRAKAAGAYSGVQADEGARIYAVRCAMCHGSQLAGSVEIPALKGKFVAGWSGRPIGDLYDYVARAMPQQAPGSLSGQDSARLVAFLLRENGAPAGTMPLPTEGPALRLRMFPPVKPN